ncbi:hypothetical protein ACEPAH_1118 [Sanghuangporus vaninii]
MNRHHPYPVVYEGPRRGNPPGPGPDRSHSRFSYDRGTGFSPRGRGRGRGGYSSSRDYGGGGGYSQSASYDSSTPESYSQWNNGPQDYYGQSSNYGDAYPPYDDSPGSYNDQGYGSYEDGPSSRGGRGGRRGGGPGLPPPRSRDEKPDPIIEERIMRERPCRTLFIRNIKYETNSDEVRQKFNEHGEIKTFFDLIANRGMVFVTYYDLRAAERARERLQNTEIGGRPIDVHYSLPRADEQNSKDPKDRNQGTLLATLHNTTSPIDDNEVRRRFQQFGDIKNVKPGDNRHSQRYVEFYDTRSCEDAYERMHDQPFQDGVLEVGFSPDIPDVPLPPGPIPQKRQEERPTRGGRDYGEYPTRSHRGGGRGTPRGRGSGFPRDDWERRDDWDRDRDRRYDQDYDSGGGGGRGRGRGRGRGGYNNYGGDRHDSRSDDYGGPPSSGGYGRGGGPPGPPPPSYGQPSGPPPPAPSAPPVDERLEQARKVQQLLAALKQPQSGGQAPVAASQQPSGAPPIPPVSGAPPYYQPPPANTPGMPPQMYPGGPPAPVPPQMTKPYGAPPPSSATSQQATNGVPAPPAPTPASLSGLPPNILAMLQQATQNQGPGGGAGAPPQIPGVPPSQMPPASAYGVPPTQQTASSPPVGGATAQDYQQLMSFLQAQAGKR